jgi:amino acid permease
MFNKPKNFYKAIGVLIGYIIGVGMFGLPFLVSRAGVLNFFLFLIGMGVLQYFVHLIYMNLIVVTPAFHRMPGYAGLYLGNWGKHLVFTAKILGNIGGLLAYIIISSTFLHALLSPLLGGSELIYGVTLFTLEAIVVFFGISMVASVELVMSTLLILVVALIVAKGAPVIDVNNFIAWDWKYMFLPFGAMLMALDGNGALPIVGKLLNKDPKACKQVVGIGTFGAMLITVLFVLTVVGISGSGTTPDSLKGIRAVLDDGVILFSMIFGVLTMTTSFILVAEAVRETLWWDYRMNRYLAWAIAVFTPFSLYLIGIRDLTSVISLAGGVAGGLSVIMLLSVFQKLLKQPDKMVIFKRKPAKLFIYMLIGLFSFGMIYELWHFVFK